MVFVQRHKKNKLISRLVGLVGILPGVWFLISTQTDFGRSLNHQCGYWFLMLFVMSFIWLFYAVFIKNILRDASYTINHAHSLNERHTAQIASFSTKFEAIVASIIFILSTIGFLLTDLSCVLTKAVESNGF